MGREIRRVPPNWEHPKKDNGNYQPMHDWDFDSAFMEWVGDYELWKKGEHPDQEGGDRDCPFWEWEGPPPDPYYHRPEFQEEPTWYQVYENVSEGTPITPPFETETEVIDYLVRNLDWDECAAERFVKSGYAPSSMMRIGSEGVTITKPSRKEFYVDCKKD